MFNNKKITITTRRNKQKITGLKKSNFLKNKKNTVCIRKKREGIIIKITNKNQN